MLELANQKRPMASAVTRMPAASLQYHRFLGMQLILAMYWGRKNNISLMTNTAQPSQCRRRPGQFSPAPGTTRVCPGR